MPSIVQQGDDGTTGINSASPATCFGTNTTIGHSVIANIPIESSTLNVISGVTSPMGTFEYAGAYAVGQADTEIWVCRRVTGAGTTITVTTSDSSQYNVQLIELNTPIKSFYYGDGEGNTSTAGLTTTVYPHQVGDFIVSLFNGYEPVNANPSSPWSPYVSASSSGYWKSPRYCAVASLFATSLSSQAAAWTMSPSPHALTLIACGFEFVGPEMFA